MSWSFIGGLYSYLRNDAERQAIVDRANDHVLANHTWEKRIHTLTAEVERHLLA